MITDFNEQLSIIVNDYKLPKLMDLINEKGLYLVKKGNNYWES